MICAIAVADFSSKVCLRADIHSTSWINPKVGGGGGKFNSILVILKKLRDGKTSNYSLEMPMPNLLSLTCSCLQILDKTQKGFFSVFQILDKSLK